MDRFTPPVANGDAVIPGTLEEEGHRPAGTSSFYYLWERTEHVRRFPLNLTQGKGGMECLKGCSSSPPLLLLLRQDFLLKSVQSSKMFLPRKHAEELLRRDGERR